MKQIVIAFRNIFRNVRRSIMTMAAIGIGAMALLLVGEFFMEIMLGLQTSFVTKTGHINVFKKGAFEYGAGNPAAYSLENYEDIIETLEKDEILNPLIHVITPTIKLFGIASNYQNETSKTFFGIGVVPHNFNKMRRWDEYKLKWDSRMSEPVMSETEDMEGIIGIGLAKILGMCKELNIENCKNPTTESQRAVDSDKKIDRDFSNLGREDIRQENFAISQTTLSKWPRLDLMTGTASGTPNAININITRAVTQGHKDLDDSFVGLSFKKAQTLLYGRNEKKANGIVIQLHRSEDMKNVRSRIEKIIADQNLDLEVRDLLELQPFYTQSVSMFKSMFTFIAIIMVIIALFTVINTVSMNVMERTQEIGTLRALGTKRRGITTQFVLEGAILGITGATVGIVLGMGTAHLINKSGIEWLPPGQAQRIPLQVLNHGVSDMLTLIWCGLVFMTIFAAWLPARRASQMKIVDALGST